MFGKVMDIVDAITTPSPDPVPPTKERSHWDFKRGEVRVTVLCSFCRKEATTGYYNGAYYVGWGFLIPESWGDANGNLWCRECDPRNVP